MNYKIQNAAISFGDNTLLEEINFEVNTTDKIAIVGRNGCGKTTILKMIMKEENQTSGDIFIRKDATIGFLSQYPDVKLNDYLVKEILIDSFDKVNELKRKLLEEEKNLYLYTDEKLEKCIARYTRIQEEYMNAGGYEVDSKIEKIVMAFKVEKLLDKKLYLELFVRTIKNWRDKEKYLQEFGFKDFEN